jgi:hypothetical protein
LDYVRNVAKVPLPGAIKGCVKIKRRAYPRQARMVKSADTADLKSADPYQVVGVQVPLRAPYIQ